MEIIPAIDILGGRCVRLKRGDFSKQVIDYGEPLAAARRWDREGATRLHVVDLDGAKAGVPTNMETIRAMLGEVLALVQVGGGIRKNGHALSYRNMGVSRVVLGTKALKNYGKLQYLLQQLGDQLVVSVDVRDGMVVTHGWMQKSTMPVDDFIPLLVGQHIDHIIYTDVTKDGMLEGPNFAEIEKIIKYLRKVFSVTKLSVAGGISKLEHLLELKKLGVESAILGSALYEGLLDLREAQAKSA